MNAHVSPITPAKRSTSDLLGDRFTVTEMMNEGRENALSDEAAARVFMMVDSFKRFPDRRCPKMGPPDLRHPLERMFAKAAAKGVQVIVGGASAPYGVMA